MINGLFMCRVAGSLSVTRAFGDMYLKKADIRCVFYVVSISHFTTSYSVCALTRMCSLNPYQQHVPYITCHPTVYFRKLHSRDTNIILASGTILPTI